MPKNRDQLKQEYIDSLDYFISQNPKIGQLDTAKFRDFLIGLVERESGFNPTAKQGSYFGWYQTNKRDADPYNQHMNAFNHLNGLFNNTITKDDIQKARALGINDSALMLKYWNQGNRVNNYLWNNKDSADGLGTLISKYGNDLTMPLDVYDYALDNIYGNYTVKEGDNWFNIQKRVRMPGRDYATAGKDLWNMQHLGGRPFGSLSIGQSFNFGEQPTQKRETYGRIIDPELSARTKALLELSNRVNYNQGTEYLTRYKKGGLLKQYGGLVYTPYNNSSITQSNNDALIYRPSGNNSEDILDFLKDVRDSRFPVEPVSYIKVAPPKDEEKPESKSEDNERHENPESKEVYYPEIYTEKPAPGKTLTVTMQGTTSRTPGTVTYARQYTDVGKMQEWIDLAVQEGVSFTIYSGVRPNAVTKSGHKSNHSIGTALDIGPGKGQTFDDLKRQILASPKLVAFMKEKGIGIINETIPEVMQQTGATGPHFHVGPDQWGLQHFERWLRNEKENLHRL